MTNITTAARHISATLIQRLLATVLLSSALIGTAFAQDSVISNSTPPGLAPGAPAGSFALSDLDNINLYNGNLNFRLPLLKMGGRGGAGYTMMLLFERHWSVNNIDTGEAGIIEWPSDGWWAYTPNYIPGWMGVRYSSVGQDGCQHPTTALIRLTFTAPDGTEFELRDQLTGGQPLTPIYNQCIGGTVVSPTRGSVFVTADGTAATFISDTPLYDNPISVVSGYLILRDGTRYRIDNGGVSWIRDRNGNKVSFTYPGYRQMEITDSVNRQVTIVYADPSININYDQITYKGFGGATRTIRVNYAPLSQALRADYTPQQALSIQQLFPELNNADPGSIYDPSVVSSVELPDGKLYRFYYNHYGELARAELPTGGAIEYDHTPGSGVVSPFGVFKEIIRSVVARRVYPNGGMGGAFDSQTTYQYNLAPPTNTTVVVNQLDQSGTLLSREKHYFYGTRYSAYGQTPISYSGWQEGKQYQTDWLDSNDPNNPDGGTVLRRVLQTWQQGCTVSSWNLSIPNNPRVASTTTTLMDTSQVSTQTFSYDCYNNQTDVYAYDIGAGAPGPLLRHTHTDYLTTNPWQDPLNYATDLNIHIRNLPTYTSVSDSNDVEISKTWFDYDPYGINGLPALQDCPGIVQHDGGFDTGYGARGNLVKITRLATSDPTGYVAQHFFYDIAGNVVRKTDGFGSPTDFDFSDRYDSTPDDEAQSNAGAPELAGGASYAFPTKVTNALGHTVYTQYDYYLGEPVNSQDANGIVSSIAYNDALDRPTQGIQARYKVTTPPCAPPAVCVPAEKRQTTITYDDANHVITMTGDRDAFGDNILTGKSYYDGLGRNLRSATYVGSTNWTIKVTQFDALGRVSQVSNPYSAVDPGSASPPSGLWTKTDYDALGRPIKLTTPDGAHVDTAYSGNNMLVIDQAGKMRISRTDALGRLTNVWEVRSPDAASGTVSVSFPNHPEITAGYQTDYFYDPLGNLRAVNQGGQGRWFSYDSLSHLIRVRNLEQNCNPNLPPHTDPFTGGYCWSTAYSYDANGNLTQKIDARGVETKYYYDALNRNYAIDYYINGSKVSSAGRIYDGAVNGKGRLYYDWTQIGGVNDINATHMAIESYDALGRPLTKRQHFWQGSGWGPGYYVQYTYDLAGNVKTQTYPSGHIVKNTYDQAGQISSFSGNLGGSPSTYADTISYNPAGQMSKERFGANTSLYHKKRYNNRLQLVDLRLSTGSDELSWDRGAITFYYGWNGIPTANPFIDDPINNGNLLAQLHYVPTASGGYVQTQGDTYGYDELNRITSVNESQWDGNAFIPNVYTQNFNYDRYGNKHITSTTGGVNNYNPVYDQATNRINGLGYDAAGNITSDPMTGGLMTYDPENRMLTSTKGGVSSSYTYNAEGKRVRRITGGQETWYIYGIGGELLAEYAAGAAPSAPQKEYGYRNGQLLVIAEPWSGGNLAWGKATSQSSTSTGGVSSRGVDGNTSGNWGDNSVSHTNLDHQAWWQVDLGSVQQIGTVRLWNRTDCCSDRLSNFWVLVSDNPFSSTDLTTTINQAGVSSYYTAGPAGLRTEIGVGRSGRYVRVQLAGDNYLSLAEVEVMGGTVSGDGVKWLVQDHLGSTRMVVDRSGSLAGIRRHDFAPFGEELFAGAIRNANNGYSGDSVRHKFTGYERDDETGLDFAQARYFSSIQGRFMSADPLMTSGRVQNPQSWNRYSYALNRPLNLIDPSGMEDQQSQDQELPKPGPPFSTVPLSPAPPLPPPPPRRLFPQHIPTQNEQVALDRAVSAARQMLLDNRMNWIFVFGKTNPVDMLDTYYSQGLITIDDHYPPQTGDNPFESDDVGGVTNRAAGSYTDANGVRISANPITLNPTGFFFTGRIADGRRLNQVPFSGFEGVFDLVIQRAIIVLHEHGHANGRLPCDGRSCDPTRTQSMRNTDTIRRLFYNPIRLTPVNIPHRIEH